jgi:hypothetical protein
LAAAETAGFIVLVTTDQNLRYQQNLATRQIAIVVLGTTSWPRIQPHVAQIQAILDRCTPGSYHDIPISPRDAVSPPATER